MSRPASAAPSVPPAKQPARLGKSAEGPAKGPGGRPPVGRRWRSRRGGSGGRAAYLLFLIPGLVLLLGVIIVPFLLNLLLSFTQWSGVGDLFTGWSGEAGSPKWTGLDNYQELFKDTEFWSSFRHNILITLAMAVIPTILGLLLAAGLFDYIGKRFGPRMASFLRACVYLPQVLPIAVAGIVWSWILAPENGALNSILDAIGLGSLDQDWLGDPGIALYSVMAVLIWVQVGFPLVIFMAGLQRVDPALHEAAEIDGAGWWQRFWHITIPQIRPEIFVSLLWCTIASLKAFAPIYVLTKGGPGGATNVPSYYSFQNFFDKTDVGYGAAIATVLALLIVGLTVVFLQRQSKGEGI